MGLISSLIGWDKIMGATNAVLASHLLSDVTNYRKRQIVAEAINIFQSKSSSMSKEMAIQKLNNTTRVIQMNFIAMACNNLGIEPTVPNNAWTRIKNPFDLKEKIDEDLINMAIDAVRRQDGVTINWPGDNVHVDFQRLEPAGDEELFEAEYEEIFLSEKILRIVNDSRKSVDEISGLVKDDDVYNYGEDLIDAINKYIYEMYLFEITRRKINLISNGGLEELNEMVDDVNTLAKYISLNIRHVDYQAPQCKSLVAIYGIELVKLICERAIAIDVLIRLYCV